MGSEFGQGQGNTLLDEVECTGNETSLQDCPASPWKQHDCQSFENAGVECLTTKCKFKVMMLLVKVQIHLIF